VCHTPPVPISGVYAFEAIDDSLPYVPLAGRRVLDAVGRKVSLEAWASLAVQDRRRIVDAGAGDAVDLSVITIVDGVTRKAAHIPPEPEPDPEHVPPSLAGALGYSQPLDTARWRALRPLDRYALVKYAAKPEKLARAYEEILGVPAPLTHLDERGAARMVDVGGKPETARGAVATSHVRTTRAVIEAIGSGASAKGDVLAAARIAGILASKRTPELIPLCHPLRTTRASIDFELDAAAGEVRVRASVEAIDRTGVEMEAMVAASIAALTIYDMIKSADRWASIESVRLEAKHGGKSGDVKRPGERP
jgi:cyclic pyranopterin phosphate synthase